MVSLGPADTRRWDIHLAIVSLAAFAMLAVLAWPVLHSEVYSADDLGNFWLPIRHFYAQCLATGQRFIWFPHEFTGFYLHGEGQAGLLHPLNLLQYRFLPFELAFGLEVARGYVLLFAGSFLLLRRWQLPRAAAAFGAFQCGFSSFVLLHYVHLSIVPAVAHLPWLLLGLHEVLWPSSPRRAAFGAVAVVLLTASQCLLGHPQFVFLSLGVEIFYCACCVWSSRSERPLRAVPMARIASWSAAKLLGVAAAGLALVPVWESLGRSFRAAPPAGFTSEFAIAPLGLVQLVAPYLFEARVVGENTTELGCYLGAVPLLLVLWSLLQRKQLAGYWLLVRASLWIGGLSLVLSLGDAGILYRLQSLLPVAGLFRAPARYMLVVQLAAAAISAIGFFDLARRPRGSQLGRGAVWLWLPLLASLGAVAFAARGSEPVAASRAAIVAGPLLIAMATVLLLFAARGSRWAVTALLVVAVVDVGVYGSSFVRRSPPQTVEAFLARFRAPDRPGSDRLHWGPPALTMKGVRLASGYVAMTPRRVLDLGPFGSPLELDSHLRNVLRVSGVRWAIGTALPTPLPRARLLTGARVSLQPDRDIGGIDVASVALVDAAVELDPGTAGRVEVTKDAPGEIELITETTGRQLLVVSESHHEGWRAVVDESPCRLRRAYGDYLACVVPAGRHRVRFSFEPTSLRRGALLSALALVSTVVWLFVALARAR
jgi:hypothetical protein